MGRPLSLLVLGLWLGMLAASWVAASVNFRTVDRVLGPALRPEVSEKLASLPPGDRRMLLRHLASEINRWMFHWWSLTQIVLGALALALLWPGGGASRTLTGIALALALVQLTTVAPIVELGRSIDFVPRPLPPELARRFGVLHAAYVGLDLVKALLLAAAAWIAARRPMA